LPREVVALLDPEICPLEIARHQESHFLAAVVAGVAAFRLDDALARVQEIRHGEAQALDEEGPRGRPPASLEDNANLLVQEHILRREVGRRRQHPEAVHGFTKGIVLGGAACAEGGNDHKRQRYARHV
jgi:hypothetical protein